MNTPFRILMRDECERAHLEFVESDRTWYQASAAQRIERWERAAQVLRDLPQHVKDEHFSMHTFGERTDCGTVACAAGHCAMDEWFKSQGLELILRRDYARSTEDLVMLIPPESFFGVEGSDVIFYNVRERPVSRVIEEIEHYVEHLKAIKTKDVTDYDEDLDRYVPLPLYRLSTPEARKW